MLAKGQNRSPSINYYMTLEICWLVANIANGPQEVLERLLSTKQVLTFIKMIMDTGDVTMKEIALWFIGNATAESLESARMLVSEVGLIESLYILVNQANPLSVDKPKPGNINLFN